MATKALASPANDADAATLVDWLELTAFFDRYEQSRLDEIAGLLALQEGETEENIADRDAENERLRELIEGEVRAREQSLLEAYPFALSDDGEVLTLKAKDKRSASSLYLLCLILSHVTKSPILLHPPADGHVRDVRRTHFQIFSTLAVAGYIDGPALSLGWPRASGESILEVVARAVDGSGTGSARAAPANTANPAAKDGGIDVLGWQPAPDRPPPTAFWFGQAASGLNWRPKSAKDEHPEFIRDYFDVGPQCNQSFITISPERVAAFWMESKSLRHGTILDRTRAPLAALKGLRLHRDGGTVDEALRAYLLPLWVGRYRAEVRKAA